MPSVDKVSEHTHIWDPSGGVRWIADLHHWMQPLVCGVCGHTIYENANAPASLDDVSLEEWGLKPLEVNPEGSGVPWRPDLASRVREVLEGEGLTERYTDVLLRGHTDPYADFDVDYNHAAVLDTWECRRHPDFLTHYREEWEFHLRDYHPRQWAQRQADLADN